MPFAFFITGTDTEIGKTYVSTLLYRYFMAKGERPVIMKPVASSDKATSEDLDVILDAMSSSENAMDEALVGSIAPVTYPKPLAPYAIKGFHIEGLRQILTDSFLSLRDKFTIIIVEGIGGVLVPIEKDFCAADIPRLLDIPVIVVAEDKLGVINHTLLTLEALRNRGLTLLGFIMNRYTNPSDGSVRGNVEIIEELSGIPCIGKVVEGKLVDVKI